MMAYDPNNFLEEYCAEGYDMTFRDQHENIFLMLLGLILILITLHSSWKKVNHRVVRFAGVAIVLFSLLNMALGVHYGEYAWTFLCVLLLVCMILALMFKKKFGDGRIFISALIFVGALIASFVIDMIDYRVCDKQNQYPPEYGLQWRPCYQGFTDNAYFSSIEKKITIDDSSRLLYNLLNDEVHSFEYPFNFLRQQGWEIKQGDSNSRIFINPNKTVGYVQIQTGGGLEPIGSHAHELRECFPSAAINAVTDFHELVDSDDIIVLTTEANDTVKLYLKNLTHDWFNDFTNLKDSVLSLPDSMITDIIPEDYDVYTLNENFYEISRVLSFHADTIKHIEYDGAILRVKFNNPQAKDKVYTNNCMIFVDSDFESGETRLRRF